MGPDLAWKIESFEPKIGLKVGENVTIFEKYCILGSFPQYYYLENLIFFQILL